MKPVVSSLVALVISLAPLSAMAAKPASHPHHGKTAHVQKHEKTVAEKADKSEKPVVRVKAGKKDGAAIKPVAHHAKDVDVSGGGHHEPGMPAAKPKKGEKNDHGGALVSASITSKIVTKNEKAADKKAKPTKHDMPKLPAPNAKPSKGGGTREGVAKKPAAKAEPASDDAGGETTRDEELAELVARIRGVHSDASAKSANHQAKNVSHSAPVPPCTKEPVEIVRGPEVERFVLTKCDGSIAPSALERFSVLIRPGGVARPTISATELAKRPGAELAPGIHRVDPRLLERVQHLADHFGKPGAPAKLFVISGYRPASVGSMHSTGRAMDFRVEGSKNEDVVAFCKTITDTGCGFYPNSSFVHMDVRDAGTGHTAWIDASGPGETPRYVTQWPPPPDKGPLDRVSATETIPASRLAEEGEDLLRAKRPNEEEPQGVPIDEHPAEVSKP